jgi:hypothetical protein
MKALRLVLLTGWLVVVVGCATGAKTDAAMKSWLNSNVSELVASWGPPDSSVQLPDGNIIYTWTGRGSYTTPTQTTTNASAYGIGNSAYGTAQSTTTGGQTIQYWCQKSFTVSASGKILSYHWQGNACR